MHNIKVENYVLFGGLSEDSVPHHVDFSTGLLKGLYDMAGGFPKNK